MIAFLGTGLLGANFTKALLKKGETVHVWNRTFSKAEALQSSGAKAFTTPAEAVQGAQRIHVTLQDDQSVDSVLENAAAGFSSGIYIIDHTTTSAAGAIDRTAKWAAKGIHYVHAPVFMGPGNALDSTGYMLISGDQTVAAKVTPWLETMTGKLLNFGATTGKAAGIKLMGNQFLISLTGGLTDMLAMAGSLGITGEDIFHLLDSWNPGAGAPARLKRMMTGKYDDPSWELQMARKDARIIMQTAADAGKQLLTIPPIAQEMDKWLEKGNAHKDWSIIAADNL